MVLFVNGNFYCFNVLKNANVRPLVGQKGPYNPTLTTFWNFLQAKDL